MRNATPPRDKFPFNRKKLPRPAQYYKSQDIKLTGGGEWKKAHCPFHPDKKHSLRVRLDSGGFRCETCRVHGGDVADFHMLLYGMGFIEAVKDLGAWDYDHDRDPKEEAPRLPGIVPSKGCQPEASYEGTEQKCPPPPIREVCDDR